MARPQNCYDPAGPIQEIIVPEDLGPNDARLREFTTACRDLATETHRKAKVIFGQDISRFTEAQRVVCLKTVVRYNPRKIPITVVSWQPSRADLRVINKELHETLPQAAPPRRKTPNLNLIELLIEGYDPEFHRIREEDLADAVTRGPARICTVTMFHMSIWAPNLRDTHTHHRPPDKNETPSNLPVYSTSQEYLYFYCVLEASCRGYYGDDLWNLLVEHLATCQCDENRYSLLPANPDLDVILASRQLDAYPCQFRGCEFLSRDKAPFDRHLAEVHEEIQPVLCPDHTWCKAC
ncbi:hypothetical protein QAD02_002158 [Eretmocerus hayati]|uniref:Uncharacterized protein n=1 Tax=Eretmocerus hayati TaxID=131215 RepID=A0ACC2NI29_9HYME|nr:hypothetical protein QAD02_002158 [Eretmocerus hayati]